MWRTMLVAATVALTAGPVRAAPAVQIQLTLKDHRFSPTVIQAPAGRPIEITLANEDAAADEFDSSDLQVEKRVTPHSKALIRLDPLNPGDYAFQGEFHAKTAQGVLRVTP